VISDIFDGVPLYYIFKLCVISVRSSVYGVINKKEVLHLPLNRTPEQNVEPTPPHKPVLPPCHYTAENQKTKWNVLAWH